MSTKTNSFSRLMAVVLTVVMLVSMLPFSAFSVLAADAKSFTVTVTDGASPIQDADVKITAAGVEIETQKTGDGGIAEFNLSDGTEYQYEVSKLGYKTETGTVELDVGSVDITLTEKNKVKVSGQVLDQDATPLVGASVELSGYGDEKTTKTSDDGAFSFSDVYAGETYTLTATFAEYKTATVKVSVEETDSSGNTIQMTKKDTEILSFEQSELTVKYGQTVTNIATATSGTADHYESLAPEVAEVDESGKITPISVGQAEIKATKSESEDYLKSEAIYKLTVELGEQGELTWVKSVPKNLTWKDTFTNTVTGGNGDGEVTYSTEDTEIADVKPDTGEVTFKKPGTATITATKAADEHYAAKTATYSITVGKAAQDSLTFNEARPDAIYYGDKFVNKATGGTVEGTITYRVKESDIADVDNEGNITAKKSGTIHVIATLAGNELYEDVSVEYQLQINKAEQKNDFRFVKGDSPITIKYGDDFSNQAIGGENSPITYQSSEESVATVDANGKITTLKKGKTVITATNPEDDRFNKKEITYTLIVEQADQSVTFNTDATEIPAITYGDAFQNEATANTKITYSSSASEIADVDGNGNLIIHKAGTVTITAKAAETDQYKSAEASYTITIKKANQTITFEKGSLDSESGMIVVETTFNVDGNHFSNAAVSDQQGKDVDAVYKVASGSNLVKDFNESTGEFTILGAGTIVISVAVDSNDCYLPGLASYTLKVEKAEQSIAFPEATYNIVSGHDFTTEEMPKAAESGELFGTGGITYSYENDDNNIVKALSADGTLKLTYRTGTVTVNATKAEDANYKEATATYVLTVDPWVPDKVYYSFTGSKTTDENEWFTGNVALAANEGYYVSYQNDKDSADWQPTLSDVVTTDGKDNEVSFYLKNADGDISALITEIVKKDETLPTVSVDTEAPSILVKLLEIISFGIWQQDTVSYTAEFDDITSGIVKTEYYIATDTTEKLEKEQLDAISDWTAYDGAIPVSKDQQYVVYVKVTDEAGNYNYASTAGTIFDATKPTINLTPSAEGNIYADGYYTGDVNFDLSVSDPAPSSGIKRVDYVVTVNKEEKVSGNLYTFEEETESELQNEWSKDSPLVVPSEDVSDTDEVLLKVTVEDLSGNISTEEVSLKIISQPAVVTVTKIEDGYYQEPQTATITVSGRANSFNKENVTIQVTAQDAAGKNVAEPGYVLSDWNKGDNGDYTATITFNGNANYSAFSVIYKDPGEKGLKGECNTEFIFTVDKTRPTGSITVAENTWKELIEELTWRFGSKTVTVTATAKDEICAPAPKIEYFKTSDTSLKLRSELEEYTDWQEFHEFEVSNDEVFVVYLKITDAAGNYDFLSSNGYILDSKEADVEVVAKENANENGYYNKDVPILIDVKEKEDATYSGIKSIEYWVENDGQRTQGETLFTFDIADPTYEQLVSSWNSDEAKKDIVVSSEANNSDEVMVHVKVIDNAGNEQTAKLALKIDVTHPKIQISYDVNNGNVYEIDGVERGFFKTSRTATVQITERTTTFNEDKAKEGLKFSGVNAQKEPVTLDRDVMIDGWTTAEGATPDEAIHTAKVTFNVDANYTFAVSYTDEAGNENDPKIDVGQSMTPYSFTVDKTPPTAQVTVKGNTWNQLLDTLTFGLWSNETFTVTASANDVTSPYVIEYIKTDSATQKTWQELDAEKGWAAFNELTVDPDEQFVVYLKVTDYAGNYIYINSDGHIVEKTAPKLTLTPDNTEIQHNGVGVYNKDVNVLIQAEDQAPYSGIQKVEYWVTCNGDETQRETLYLSEYVRDTGLNNNGGKLTVTEDGQKTEKEGKVPSQAELKASFAKTITVDAEKNNSCDVDVYVGVTDNAGNYTEETVALDIDITAPTIQVSYDNNAVRKTVDGRGYFPAGRTATIVITERTGHFSAEDAISDIEIQAVDADEKTITVTGADGKESTLDTKTLISKWFTAEVEGDENAATHTATIDFTADANYDFSISYTDLAKWTNKNVETGDSVTPYCFTVDKTQPTGTVTVEELGTWDKLIEILTFGLWSRDTVSVSGTSDDATSPIESVDYFKTPDIQAKTEEDLKDITDWTAFTGFDVSPNERFAVYVRIIDFAGNTTYISTDGIIVDDQLPVVEKVEPEITITPPQPVNEIYNTDVTVAVKVYDPITGDDSVYSGLKEIRYEVLNLGAVTQQGVLYSFDVQKPTQPQLLQTWEKEDAITVETERNNSNDVVVKVYAVDNAGNKNENSVAIKIDTTAPSIAVAYDNNDGDTSFTDGTYFKANRKATITVTERNFDPEKVSVTIKNQHEAIPTLSGWRMVDGKEPNGDDTKHVATILYDTDGDYTFAISSSDQAGNANTPVNYGTSLAPTSFTIDKTIPMVNVEYDNNSAQNGNYYKAQRTATITVTEHNFETSRVAVKLTATDNGAQAAVPTVSNWSTNGDMHTATITYAADSLYTFDFAYTDKAGNATANIDEQRFYVDKTNPEVTIKKVVTGEGIENKRLDDSANDNDGNIGFVITATDTNFDVFTPVLTAVVKNGDGFETKQLNIGTMSDIANGKTYTVSNIDTDGIYTIQCTVVDKAGNAYAEIHLEDQNGSPYVENRSGNDSLVVFSVNRDGSTFMLDQTTSDMVHQYYVQNVLNDVVVVEVNADPLSEHHVTVNGKEAQENSDYSVSQAGGNGSWLSYTYKIHKSLFEAEGEYKVVVSSKDKADNDAFSDVKNASIDFVVDRTKPVVTVTGLAAEGRYQTDKQTVTLVPTDDGGALKSLIVRLVKLDKDGNATETFKELINLSGDELEKALENGSGKIVFEITEGLYQNVQIICNDCAVDADGKTNTYEDIIKNVSVSSSAFMIFWANKPLRWGSIAGVSAIAIGLILLIVFKKRKKDKSEKK